MSAVVAVANGDRQPNDRTARNDQAGVFSMTDDRLENCREKCLLEASCPDEAEDCVKECMDE